MNKQTKAELARLQHRLDDLDYEMGLLDDDHPKYDKLLDESCRVERQISDLHSAASDSRVAQALGLGDYECGRYA